jgi:hypothetical protein
VASLRVTSPPAHASSIVDAGQYVKYTAELFYVGLDAYEYEICDLGGTCGRAFVTVTVTP